MDDLFRAIASATGASIDQVKLIACLVVNYPLGSIFVRIPRSTPALKHLFSIVVSAIYLLPVLNLWSGTLQLLVISLVTYILAAVLHGKNMPWIVFTVVMGHLTYNHALRAIYEIPYEAFEVTGPQMVLTMKLTTYAWNVFDGRRSVEELDKWQLKHRVVKIPSLFEFLGYVFYFPGILVGPYTEYATYAALIDGSLFGAMAEGQVKGSKRKFVPHGRKRVAYTRMMQGFFFMALFVLLGEKYNYEATLTPDFVKHGPITRLFFFQFFGFTARTKYYSAWLLTEGAAILTGLGFTGYTPSGDSRWDGASNVNIPAIEWSPNFKLLLDAWNMNTNIWLRESVYKRVARKGKKPGFKSTMFTFLTSAFWHGFAAGYYMTFILGGLVAAAARQCRANFRPLLVPPEPAHSSFAKRIYDFVGAVASTSSMNFCAGAFMIGHFDGVWLAWQRVYFYTVVGTASILLFFAFGGKHLTRQLAAARIKKAQRWEEETTKGIKVANGKQVEPVSHQVPPVDIAMSKVEKKLS
ncbi:hypothetical protein M422DRAFT_218786 [Sphaerobolus stellatus SS14]|nr:hypothetical protein M422DRAFT_218786 [Sphaerobolus stellatus SS14]